MVAPCYDNTTSWCPYKKIHTDFINSTYYANYPCATSDKKEISSRRGSCRSSEMKGFDENYVSIKTQVGGNHVPSFQFTLLN